MAFTVAVKDMTADGVVNFMGPKKGLPLMLPTSGSFR